MADVNLSESGEIEAVAEAQSGGLPTAEGTGTQGLIKLYPETIILTLCIHMTLYHAGSFYSTLAFLPIWKILVYSF